MQDDSGEAALAAQLRQRLPASGVAFGIPEGNK